MIIHVREHGDGWIAWRNKETNVWEFGQTKEEAVYKLLVTLQMID